MTAAPLSASLPTWLVGPPNPVFWVLHIAGGALMIVAVVVGGLWRRRRMKGNTVAYKGRGKGSLFLRGGASFDDTALEVSYTGGMRYGYMGFANWSRPLVTLDLYDSGLELRSTYSFLRFLVPVWRARYDEISSVGWLGRPIPDPSAVAGLVMARGIMLTASNGDWVIFWCLRRNEVLDALARRGLRIEAERKRLTVFGPV